MIKEFEFTVANPNFSYLYLIIPLIIFLHIYFLRHAKKRSLKFGNFQAMKRVEGSSVITKNLTPLFIMIVIFSSLIASLMGISFWIMDIVSETDYMVALDAGASMNAQDLFPDRFTVAKDISKTLISNLTGSRVGFVSFGGVILKSSSPLTYKSFVLDLVDDTKISNTGTDIGLALDAAMERFENTNKSKVIILISDGHDTVGIPVATSLSKAVERHIKIFTIGVGTKEGGKFLELPSSEGLISRLNEEMLVMISNTTFSKYINIDDESKKNTILNEVIGDTNRGFVEYKLDSYFIMTCIVLLFLLWLLDNTRFRIFP